MHNINKVILIGNIARNPELRVTSSGQKMATFTLVTNRNWYTPDGNRRNQAEFHNIVAWGKTAEICERFLQKGTLAYCEGYLKTRTQTCETTGKRLSQTEIVVHETLVLDRGIRYDDHGKPVATATQDDGFFAPEDNLLDDEPPPQESQ